MTGPAPTETLSVDRRWPRLLGWVFFGMAIPGLLTALFDPSFALALSALAALAFAWTFLQGARNVTEIVVTPDRIRFLPVGADLSFAEVTRMKVPSWADRWDTPHTALVSLELETTTDTLRWVPGAILQWNRGRRINIGGSEALHLLAALRRHLPE